MIVYSIKFANEKRYIGVTKNFGARFKAHRSAKTLIGRALRKYGPSNAICEVMFEGDAEECYAEERRLVEILDCMSPNGYNQTAGGMGGLSPCEEVRARMKAIKERTNSDPTYRESQRQKSNRPEILEINRAQMQSRWDNNREELLKQRDAAKPRQSASLKIAQNRPEVAEKKRIKAKVQWSSPESRERILAGIRKKKGG